MSIIIDGTGTISGVSATGLTTAQTVTQSAIATGVAGTGPAFFAYPNANQTITANSFTKVQLQSESFDTANCFDNTTNYRFTPNVAGYYMFSFAVSGFNSTTPTRCFANIYKNGSGSIGVYGNDSAITSSACTSTGTFLTYLNGTTDYIELYAYISAVTAVVSSNANPTYTFLSGALVRAA